MIVKVCILEEFELGTKAAGGAVPLKQLLVFVIGTESLRG